MVDGIKSKEMESNITLGSLPLDFDLIEQIHGT